MAKGGVPGGLLAATFEQQLDWVCNQVEWLRQAKPKGWEESAHVLLSLAESVKLAKRQHSEESDRRELARLSGRQPARAGPGDLTGGAP